MSLWDEVKGNLGELYTATSEKTSELARISSRRYDKFGISREIERQFSELGNFVYVGLKDGKEDLLSDETVNGFLIRIQDLEEELKNKDQEIRDIQGEYSKRKDSSENSENDDDLASERQESTEEMENVATSVITDPILETGQSESAILMEPGSEEEEKDD